jgi:hypothetical protein
MSGVNVPAAVLGFGLLCVFFLPMMFAFRARDWAAVLGTLVLLLLAAGTFAAKTVLGGGIGAMFASPALSVLLWLAALITGLLCDVRRQTLCLNGRLEQMSRTAMLLEDALVESPRYVREAPRRDYVESEPRY